MAYLQAQIPTHPTYPMSGNITQMPPLPLPSFMPSTYMQPQLPSSPVFQTINQPSQAKPSETPMPPFPPFIAPSNLPQTQFVPPQPTQGPTTPHHPFIPPTYVAPTMPPPNHTAMYGPPPVSPPVYIVIPSMEPGSGRRGPHRRRRQSFCLVCRKRTHETKNCRKLRSAAASTRGFWQ